ncbi:MAG: AAA family ATPase, partial [Clostridia bacterium]
MLCSECNKNPAILFYKKIENGKESLEGYCYDCAKKKGINPTEVLHDQNNILSNDKININDMTKQFETIFKDLAENINLEDIENLDGAITFESQEQNPDSDEPSKISGAAIPLGSIFSNMFSNKASKSNSDESEELNDGRRKVKVEKKKNKKQNKKKKFLDTFGTNLTDKAKNNELDIVIGREKEIQRIVQILNRRSKNNPCLIGEPGVGKTAIAQGLAIKIANQNVPAKLLNKEVYLLDMTAVIAGTQFRGQFESRMKGIIDECKEYGNIILVIDEIHNIIGAGDGEHSMNAANILKPALSNGEIQLIGTTTLKEYRKYIEKDSALERRFQQVLVEEPNIEDSIVILEGIKKYYEEYHKVKISSDIIRQAVIMSEKYIHDRFLPDKAIDILDEACSRINLENKDLFKLEMLKQELAKVQSEKEEVIAADSTEDYQKAADLKTRECQLIEEIDKLSAKAKPKQLNVQDIANVIESWTKIPVKKITEAETQKLLNLETNLHKRIIGQDEAVSSVARAIRRNRAGLQSTKRPPSFIFVGPTGVGKTELAKSLAYEMFGSEDSIIRIDMSEYMESHSTSKLIGAPPGYVGYDDAGQLTDKVKRKPYSIILL